MSAARLTRVALTAALAAVAAQVSIPVPGSPVPVVLSNLVAVLAGLVLGPRDGALAMTVYVLLGAAGLPVYAGGHGGPTALVGPTGGYLAGFVLAAWVAGALRRRTLWGAASGAMAVIYLPGLLWLHVVAHLGWAETLLAGAAPFVVGDALKVIGAVAISRASRALPLSRAPS
jgi:biotin transport system substrate-specific component